MKVSLVLSVSITAIIAALGMAAFGLVFASSGTVSASASVSNSVYVSAAPSSNTFGNVYPGSTYDTNVLFVDTDNGGNIESNIMISGAGWTFGSNSIGVSNTLWSGASQSSYTGTALTGTLSDTSIEVLQPTISAPSQSNSIYFGVNIPGGTPAGSYSQTLTFENKNFSNPLSSSTATVTLTANVQSICYISLSPATISFGNVASSANVPTASGVTDTDTGGNAQASVLVEGSGWTGPSSFGVSNTLWSGASQSSYTGTALTGTLAATGLIIPGATFSAPSPSNSIYFGLGIPAGTAGGSYTQTITIENSC